MARLSTPSALALVCLLAASLVALASAGRAPGVLDNINAGLAKQGFALGQTTVHNNVVRRELLLTTCDYTSVSITTRKMQLWKADGTYMWELNITNNCQYNMVRNARFSYCTYFTNTDTKNGLINPASPKLSCQTGPTFDLVDVTLSGVVYSFEFCQLYMNNVNCADPTQIVGGGRVRLYYFSKTEYKPCGYLMSFRHNSTYVSNSVNNAFMTSPGSCAVKKPDYAPPAGYSCTVSDTTPGLIYCPPF